MKVDITIHSATPGFKIGDVIYGARNSNKTANMILDSSRIPDNAFSSDEWYATVNLETGGLGHIRKDQAVLMKQTANAKFETA